VPALPRAAHALARAGYRFGATEGTAAALAGLGYDAQLVAKVGEKATEGRVPILTLIASGRVRLVVNTPSPKSGPVRDAAEIRLAATAEGILCLTAMETAVAAAEALDPDLVTRLAEVRSLGEWVPEHGKPRGMMVPS
jgi:carbamoyl-phosphate synthase large subunit